LEESVLLSDEEREALWRRVTDAVESYIREIPHRRVTPVLRPDKIHALLQPIDFDTPMEPAQAVDFIVDGLLKYQTHTPHPRYYGLFNPAPTAMGIAADTLVAAFNPQLAAWSHSPLAVDIEHHLIRHLGARFGYAASLIEGTFTNAGAEANHTAVLVALSKLFPHYEDTGLRSLPAQPVMYVSAESHHSLSRAARITGLGAEAMREVPVDDDLRMKTSALQSLIRRDREKGCAPFLIVATAGTTNAGAIDPLNSLADIAAREELWLHADAAWGGAAALVPELKHSLRGIERADSITFDAHKWLSVPMAAGIFITRHAGLLNQAFRIDNVYMPKEGKVLSVMDPYASSVQWSRRFIGLKVFLSLAVAGWGGYARVIRRQTRMGHYLRDRLLAKGWEILNRTPLPLVCFVDCSHPGGRASAFLDAIANEIVTAGRAWISTTRIKNTIPVLRACITNYRTDEEDINALVDDLEWARRRVMKT
jgi:glutamate/tyrosine decarboxylase-like PLP-dependent enzyme